MTKKHNVLLFVRTESQLMLAANAAGEITISATVTRTGHFNDKTTVTVGHAEAAHVAAQPPDDARGVHRFRVAERYYFRPFPLRDGFQHRERLGGVLHRFSLKVVSP